MEYKAAFNYFYLINFINIHSFNITFPKEIFNNIFIFYFAVGSNDIANNIHIKNICICEEEKCRNKWYNNMHTIDITEKWKKYECETVNCHNICIKNSDGFQCYKCQFWYCLDCELLPNDAFNYNHQFSYCKHCHEYSESQSSNQSSQSDDQDSDESSEEMSNGEFNRMYTNLKK